MTERSISYTKGAHGAGRSMQEVIDRIIEVSCKDMFSIMHDLDKAADMASSNKREKALKKVEGSIKLILDERRLQDGQALLAIILQLVEKITRLSNEITALKDTIDYSSDSIVVADGAGKILLANKAFEANMGVKVPEVLGRKVIDLEQEEMFKPSVIALVLREKRRVTIIQKTRTGTDVVVTGVPVFSETGEIYRVISNAKDLTELKMIKEYLTGYENMISLLANGGGKAVNIICHSKIMQNIVNSAKNVANAASTVLITGESGVGKEVIAKYIHQHSGRSKQKFVQINCGAIPETLMESELFGYEAGAFTGAMKGGKAGLIEVANKGTLFLDEIAEMPCNMQVKLLTAIQSKQITRVGGTKPIYIDVRYIAATNKDLEGMVATGSFRLDLYYRLNVIPIHIPALKNRKEDIVPLIENVLDKMNRQFQKKVALSQRATDALLEYDWPGNIRELENVLERIVVTADKTLINKEDLPIFTDRQSQVNCPIMVNKITTLAQAFAEVEKQLIILTHKNCGSSYKIAKVLGISQSAAHRKMQKYLKKS